MTYVLDVYTWSSQPVPFSTTSAAGGKHFHTYTNVQDVVNLVTQNKDMSGFVLVRNLDTWELSVWQYDNGRYWRVL